MRLTVLLLAAAAVQASILGDAGQFIEGAATGLVKGAIGSDGFQAATDADNAFNSCRSAASDYLSGNDQGAWDNLRSAGYSTLGCVTKGVEQFTKDSVNTAVDGIAGAGLAAVQAVPGANIAIDAGVAAYDGYKVGSGISGIANDMKTGNWKGAGESLVGLGKSFNAGASSVVDGLCDNVADGAVSNTFQQPSWPSSAAVSGGYSFPGFEMFRRRLAAGTPPSWAPKTITFSATEAKFNVAATKTSLMSFYNSNGGPATKLQWNTGTSYCNWQGVTCNETTGALTKIDVANAGLSGSKMDAVCSLADLEVLIVEGNSITKVPTCLSTHKKLRYINVASNGISGGFPSFLISIPSIRTVDVRDNKMTGAMPDAKFFAQATHLRAILTANNQFTGGLNFLNHNHELHIIDVRNNNHVDDLGNMKFCQHMPLIHHLYVSDNAGITGTLPDFDNCPHLMTLHLANTKVNGNVPASMGKMPRLREVNATNTQLTGELPVGGILSGRDDNRGAYFEGTSVTKPSSNSKKGVDTKSVFIGVGASLGVAAVIAAVVMRQQSMKTQQNEHTQLQMIADHDARRL